MKCSKCGYGKYSVSTSKGCTTWAQQQKDLAKQKLTTQKLLLDVKRGVHKSGSASKSEVSAATIFVALGLSIPVAGYAYVKFIMPSADGYSSIAPVSGGA
jgi:hypothetical protein